MDGFHRSNDELHRLGLSALKGVPDSFDAEAFVAAVSSLRWEPPADVAWPTYDRDAECVIAAGTTISANTRLVLVEGNYLLLQTPPWDQVRPLLDAVWYLDVPIGALQPRLLERQSRDRSPEAAARKVASTDLPNATLVAATKARADVVLTRAGSA
jgi:pantothenate kinase